MFFTQAVTHTKTKKTVNKLVIISSIILIKIHLLPTCYLTKNEIFLNLSLAKKKQSYHICVNPVNLELRIDEKTLNASYLKKLSDSFIMFPAT